MQNGASYHHETIADIKASAKEMVHKARGASAITLLASARSQMQLAQARENEGDFKGALSSFTKAASLIQLIFESSDFKTESQAGKKGALFKEFMDFQQVRIQFLIFLLIFIFLGRWMVRT